MDSKMISGAAAFLASLWQAQERCAALPEDFQPQSRLDGYQIQALHMGLSRAPLAGWKIAATSVAGQKHIGVDGPLAGRYIAERVVEAGEVIPFGDNHMRVAEVEFAFRIGRDLMPRAVPYTEEEVFAAVASAHPAIEIPDSRFDRFERVGAAALIADNACANWMALGKAMPEQWRDMDLAAFAPVGRTGKGVNVAGKGANVLGSPRIAMTWIANELSALGIVLKAGEFVTTGTCLVPMAIQQGDHVTGDFGTLGSIDVRLA